MACYGYFSPFVWLVGKRISVSKVWNLGLPVMCASSSLCLLGKQSFLMFELLEVDANWPDYSLGMLRGVSSGAGAQSTPDFYSPCGCVSCGDHDMLGCTAGYFRNQPSTLSTVLEIGQRTFGTETNNRQVIATLFSSFSSQNLRSRRPDAKPPVQLSECLTSVCCHIGDISPRIINAGGYVKGNGCAFCAPIPAFCAARVTGYPGPQLPLE
jgi:hypothetical protein